VEHGSLYPALRPLVRQGWISAKEGMSENNRRAKYYTLTAKGRGPTESLPEGVAYAYSTDIKPGETREFKTAMPVSKNSVHHFGEINAY